MSLSAKQVQELEKPLSSKHVATRKQSGRALSYIEGWHAIAEANRIFGFDGWQRETVLMQMVREPELIKTDRSTTWRVGFMAKVRVTVGDIVREGTGYGSGAIPDLGESIESAIKEAETDAMKRALMTFGNPFGLALYDRTQANVSDEEEMKPQAGKSTPFDEDPDPVLSELRTAAMHGTASLRAEWEALSNAERRRLETEKEALKEAASKADLSARKLKGAA